MSSKPHISKPLCQRDIEILIFMWRWKLVSTAQIAVWFFRSPKAGMLAYFRLSHLRLKGLVTEAAPYHKTYAWSLTKNGFNVIKRYLPTEVNDGFRSEALVHDYLVTAIHLGPWQKLPEGVELFSEQELRSLPMDSYPDWVPKTDIHRPDGYWFVPIQGKLEVVALEVELHNKSTADYEMVARFYKDRPTVLRVIWVVPTLARAHLLSNKFQESTPKDYKMNNFILLSDLFKQGWFAPIVCGFETGKALVNILDRAILKSYSNFSRRPIADGRKTPYNLGTCPTCAEEPFCNCVPISTTPNSNASSISKTDFINLSLVNKEESISKHDGVNHE